MALDQLLIAHKVGAGVFEVSGLRTISIRDQVLRARLLVDRLVDEKLVSNVFPLLVVGGGAGGVTAALHAATRSIPVHLCEQHSSAFTAQQRSERWLDPTQYDWPAEHWHQGIFPLQVNSGAPLRWSAAPSTNLAAAWEVTFLKRAINSPWIQLHWGTPVTRGELTTARIGGHPTVRYAGLPHISFGAALSFVGFGSENTTVNPSYKGFEFWSADPYGCPDLDLPRTRVRAVVSGGGDGALQDFLRLTIGDMQPGEVVRLLAAMGVSLDEATLLRAEDAAHRACLWAPSSGDEHHVLERWHNAYESEVDAIWSRMTSRQRQKVADCLVPDLVSTRPMRQVSLAFGCTHFSFCYALNRFVALLVARAYSDATGKHLDNILRYGSGVTAVQSLDASHVCGDPVDCHGVDHRVQLGHRNCQGNPGHSSQEICNVIIIRHGVRFSPLFNVPPFAKQHFLYDAP